jgi:hypothetical protein
LESGTGARQRTLAEIRKIFKQIRPEDRRAICWWLTEGHQFGEAVSRNVCEFFARGEFLSGGSSEEVVRVTEVLEPLILRKRRDIDAAFDVLVGMDLESERLSELNEQE